MDVFYPRHHPPVTQAVRRNTNMQKRRISLLLLLTIALLAIVYFQYILPSQFSKVAITPEEFPDYLGGTFPEPNSKVSFFELIIPTIRFNFKSRPSNLVVSTTLYPANIDTRDNLLADGDQLFDLYCERTTLLIDGKEVSKDKFIAISGIVGLGFMDDESDTVLDGGPYWMYWYPTIWLGKHEAKIVIENRKGDKLEYNWEFVVTIW